MSAHKPVLWASSLLLLSCVANVKPAVKPESPPPASPVLFIAPDGKDSWSGKIAKPSGNDGPLATLQGARDALRKLRSSGNLQSATVEIANGYYEMPTTLTLGPEDSGTSSVPVVYQAASGAHPIFSAGTRLKGFKAGSDGLWTLDIPEVKAGKWYFSDLYVNGRRALRAQSVAPGQFNLIPAQLNYSDPRWKAEADNREFVSMLATKQDVAPLLSMSPDELKDVIVEVYHTWLTTMNYVESVTPLNDPSKPDYYIIKLKGRPYHDPFYESWQDPVRGGKLGDALHVRRYVLMNYKAAVNQPGEWFLSRSGTLYYKPRSGESPDSATVVAPRLLRFVDVKGTQSNQVHDVQFRGLVFAHSDYDMPDDGLWPDMGLNGLPAAFFVNGANNIVIDRCEFNHVAAHAVWFDRFTDKCSLTNSYLHDIGAAAVTLGQVRNEEGQRNIIQTMGDPSDHHLVDNNIIRYVSLTYKHASGIMVGYSGYSTVTHNDISDCHNDGIHVRPVVTLDPNRIKNLTISFNNIHDIGYRRSLADFGGIHTMGPMPDSVLEGNYIHDIVRYQEFANGEGGYGGSGIYADAGTTLAVFKHNLVVNTGDGPVQLSGGRKNLFDSNVLVLSKQIPTTKMPGKAIFRNFRRGPRENLHQGQFAYLNSEPTFTFTHNIVATMHQNLSEIPGSYPAFSQSRQWTASPRPAVIDNNLYYSLDGSPINFPTGMNREMGPLSEWQRMQTADGQGYDLHSRIGDPHFVSPSTGNYLVRSDSPAFAMGYTQLELSQMGVTDPQQLQRLSKMHWRTNDDWPQDDQD